MEAVLSPESGRIAFGKVRSNRGAPRCDSVTVEELEAVFPAQWAELGRSIKAGTYRPHPLRRVEIPKADGGVRKLGIPSVMDRVVQQALAQALATIFEPRFSPSSFAYRPGRSAIDAVKSIQARLRHDDGFSALHLDIRSFFDSVDHGLVRDHLSGQPVTAEVLDLVDVSIRCGVLEKGLVRSSAAGIPQGSPLSPLLANVVLDSFDRWLTRRHVAFARYADDLLLLVPSLAEGRRLIEEAADFLSRVLRLELNKEKTRLGHWSRASFLGFGFRADAAGGVRRCVSPESLAACRAEVENLAAANGGGPERAIVETRRFLSGWTAYYRHTEFAEDIREPYAVARDRVRMCRWAAWESAENRQRELICLGIDPESAAAAAREIPPPLPLLRCAMPDESFRGHGLADPLAPAWPGEPGRQAAARMEYGGSIPRSTSHARIRWGDSLLWFLRRLFRSRLLRVRLETCRSRRGFLPRPSAIGIEIGGFCFRFRL